MGSILGGGIVDLDALVARVEELTDAVNALQTAQESSAGKNLKLIRKGGASISEITDTDHSGVLYLRVDVSESYKLEAFRVCTIQVDGIGLDPSTDIYAFIKFQATGYQVIQIPYGASILVREQRTYSSYNSYYPRPFYGYWALYRYV